MQRFNTSIRLLTAAMTLLACATTQADSLFGDIERKLVAKDGTINLPSDYRKDWSHIGSWLIADDKAPGHGFHDVYSQPEAVQHYRDTGEFADGTVLVKEVRAVEEGAQTTGHAQWAGDINIWFVMIKDTEGRFVDNKHWAEGWGWALFESKDPTKNVSKSFAETCQGCHIPAKNSDWVFVNGYPTLTEK